MAINLNNNNQVPQGVQNQQQQVKPRSSGFTNIQRILGANQGNKLGQTIGQGVQNITNKTQGQVQGAQQQFGNQIGASQADINKGQEVQKSLSNLDFSKDPNEANQAIGNIASDEYTQRLSNLRQGYKGPSGLQNQEQLQNQAQDLQQTGQGLLTSGGRQAALQRFVNAGPNYTQGKQRLDNLLLGQNTQDLREARRGAQQTAMGTQQAIGTAANQAQTVGQQYGATNVDVNKALKGAQEGYTKGLTGRVSEAQQAGQTQAEELQNAVATGSISPEQYEYFKNNILGGDEQISDLTAQELSKMVSYDPSKYNISNIATQGDVNTRNALAKLAGITNPEDIQKIDANQMGQPVKAISGSEQGLNAIKEHLAATQAAQNAFAVRTQGGRTGQVYVPGYTKENPGKAYYASVHMPFTQSYGTPGSVQHTGTSAQLGYDQLSQAAPIIQQLKEAEAAGQDTTNIRNQLYDLSKKMGTYEERPLGVGGWGDDPNPNMEDFSYRDVEPYLNAFNEFNTQHSVGRKLSDLISKGPMGPNYMK